MTRVEKVILVLIVSLFILPASVKIMPKLINVQCPYLRRLRRTSGNDN